MKELGIIKYKEAKRSITSGHEQENLIRRLMELFNRQEVSGELFGQLSYYKLPNILEVSRFYSSDGQIEVDAIGKTDNNEIWIVEVKWRKKKAGFKELNTLINKGNNLPFNNKKTYWFISKVGFTTEAKSFARSRQLLITDEISLQRLVEILT